MVEAKRVVTWHFYFTKLMPIGLFMAATLHFGNLVYLYLTVSFIQMLKVNVDSMAGLLSKDQHAVWDCCVHSWLWVVHATMVQLVLTAGFHAHRDYGGTVHRGA